MTEHWLIVICLGALWWGEKETIWCLWGRGAQRRSPWITQWYLLQVGVFHLFHLLNSKKKTLILCHCKTRWFSRNPAFLKVCLKDIQVRLSHLVNFYTSKLFVKSLDLSHYQIICWKCGCLSNFKCLLAEYWQSSCVFYTLSLWSCDLIYHQMHLLTFEYCWA